ncbi:hypothetical protein A2422_03630 [Candidatus Woesebacteria bacterium RIFOXYC1_FULL_31_51]|uniref:Uncharacterized protein n=1 Tax=Candidatus Woesebacteria bacterium GW2011_GWC2_31_9 TaxID=1618586 RepID=A0A0G0BJS0_9BACT|nr:MAG: hypothetical protein UR17_C0001G0232 [Candidatus Woesebacteria bacterium GW2011_GWF1_31_35]KKP23271.1 MAG: hypothetical protein UR11_C0001G0245 [Candidatus Woesebacteria bacterium GW2011_GWC1_30_29]KKP26210.1 MAG: hypothetical protein UR13_C0005G0093 [Candidatus Woesebacteria bacterium GW2011_GWD1_31_12]KKP27533.1 MAG: hypothetical protein UR16_C0003G0193 [Candidatus Woesebacteria bacterium GW2011_GWB1_31_29]KKP31292.1 MAG: hypothetical protein UR21_C0012G0033 [Candidatus Woesebacteria 
MKNTKLPSVIVLLILTSITIVFWVFFNIYYVVSKKTPATVSEEILSPINPKLDTEVINQMEKRSYP